MNIEFFGENLHQTLGVVYLGNNPLGAVNQPGNSALALRCCAAEQSEASGKDCVDCGVAGGFVKILFTAKQLGCLEGCIFDAARIPPFCFVFGGEEPFVEFGELLRDGLPDRQGKTGKVAGTGKPVAAASRRTRPSGSCLAV